MQGLIKGGWISSLNDIPEPKARLICFSHEGGSADFFKSWLQYIRADIELMIVQLPGRAERVDQPLMTDVDQVVSSLVESCQSILDKPYMLFGHSLGAVLAFETVMKLSEMGLRLPKRLVISGRQAPTDKGSYFQKMSQLDDQDFFEDLVNDDCLGQWVMSSPEEVSNALPYIRADFEMLEGYQPASTEPLNIPIDVFAGSRDAIPLGNLLEWQKVSRYPVHVCVFKGGHFFVEDDQISVLNHLNELFDEVIVSAAYA